MLFAAPPATGGTFVTLDPPPGLKIGRGDEKLFMSWDPTSMFGLYHPTVAVRWRVKDTDPNRDGDQPGGWLPGSPGFQLATNAHVGARRVPVPVGRCLFNALCPLRNGTTYEVGAKFSDRFEATTGWISAGEGTPAGVPGAAAHLFVLPGDGRLHLFWPAPPNNGSAVTGYDVHYTSASADDVGNDDDASGNNPAAAWVAVARTEAAPPATGQAIADLADGTAYRVRVRAVNAIGDGAWGFGEGTPVHRPPLSLSASAVPARTYTVGAPAIPRSATATHGLESRLPEAVANSGGFSKTYSISGLPDGLSMGSDRVVRGTPEAATVRPVTVTYTVTDENGASDSLTFEVTVRPPLVFPDALAFYGKVFWYNFDNTIGGVPTTLPMTLPEATGGHGPLTYRLIHNRTRRPLVEVAAGLTFDPDTRTVAGQPQAGRWAFSYWVEDANGARAVLSSELRSGGPVNGGEVLGGGGDEEQRTPTAPLTASFEQVPPEHDGQGTFALLLRLSETVGKFSKSPRPSSFKVTQGRVRSVEQAGAGLWRVRIGPASWRDVTVTLAGGRACDASGAVCTPDGRALANTASATIGGPARIVTKRSAAKEGKDDAVVFTVRLSRAASGPVTVDWATADGAAPWKGTQPARAGADYTASSGALAFAAGETRKTVAVPILDDAVDEGTEHFVLRFSNPRGAYLRNRHRETVGLIVNDDHLQAMWLARFGRMVGSQVTDAVSERLQGGLAPGAHATLAGQRVDLSKADDGKALAEVMTGLARTFGAPSGPAADDDGPFARHGLADPWNDTAAAAPARPVTGRELLLGSSFHLATGGERAGPGLAAWGRVAQAGFEGEHADDTGRTSVEGTVMTGVLGADADFGRLLAGVAVSLSEGDGSFDNPGADVGGKGDIESTMTTVSPYARFKVTERVTAWGLAGWGTGDMTIRFDDGRMAPVRTDLSMQLGAVGARGELLRQDEAGGMDLALKADAFFVTTESEKAVNSAETTADASRLRLVLEGGRSFALGGGATVRPSLELGVRHDGGDAETGTGVELGGGVAFTDADSGLSIEARARMLVAHADSDYEEWGASATARLDPGERGRGLSFSLAPTIGATSSAAERLWGAHDARGLAPGSGAFEAARGLQGAMGYGMALLGDRFTGTPNLGFGMSDGGARDWRIGWRLTSAVEGDPGFEVSLDAVRREAANDNAAEHGVMLRSLIRW